MDQKLNIVIIFGTSSLEHQVSLNTALNVSNAMIKADKYSLVFIGITKENKWLYSDNINEIILINNKTMESSINNSCHEVFQIGSGKINTIKIDCAFLTTHGKMGEDGTLQGYLAMNNIPFTGCGVIGSSVCFNKNISKYVAKSQNIDVPPFICINKKTYTVSSVLKNLENFGDKLVVKVNCGGSSIGVFFSKKEDVIKNIDAVFKMDEMVLAEEFINSVELSIGLIENNGVIEYGSVFEIKKKDEVDNFIFSYDYKYKKNGFKKDKFNDLSGCIKNKLIEYSTTLFNTLNIKNYARFDYFLCLDTGKIYFNEINTLPGISANGLFIKGFSDKYKLIDIIDLIIKNAINK